MEYKNMIELSPLRIFSEKEEVKNTSDNLQVSYRNGIYYLLNNFNKFNELKKEKKTFIEVEVIGNISDVVNHIELRVRKEKLNPIESALLFKELEQFYNVTTKNLALKLNKTEGDLSNKKRLLKLPLYIQSSIIKEEMTERHGRALLQLINKKKEERLREVYEEILKNNLKVADSEDIINEIIGKEIKKRSNTLKKVKDGRKEFNNKIAIPAINQIENDLKNSISLIEKYYPELVVTKEVGMEKKDYVIKVSIKNVK